MVYGLGRLDLKKLGLNLKKRDREVDPFHF